MEPLLVCSQAIRVQTGGGWARLGTREAGDVVRWTYSSPTLIKNRRGRVCRRDSQQRMRCSVVAVPVVQLLAGRGGEETSPANVRRPSATAHGCAPTTDARIEGGDDYRLNWPLSTSIHAQSRRAADDGELLTSGWGRHAGPS